MSDSDDYSDSEGSDSGSSASSPSVEAPARGRGRASEAPRSDPSASMTLADRLREMEDEREARARGDESSALRGGKSMKKRKRADSDSEGHNQSDEEGGDSSNHGRKGKKASHKNAPAEMRSNRPVSRWRQDPNLKQNKFRDPRFSDISGKFDADKFYDAYSFLDKYQEDDVKHMAKGLKKVKNEERKEELKTQLQMTKQEMAERRRALKVREKLREIRTEEKEKVKNGKNPFFLKKAAVKEIALEERYNELKQSGKLNSFLAKKRQKNSNKDHLRLPKQRRNTSAYE